jgi:hypothetical protein
MKKISLKFKKGKQSLLLNEAIEKIGSEKKLANLIKIPKTSIYSYRNEIHPLPIERAKKLVKFLSIDFKETKRQIEQIEYKGWNDEEIDFLKENYLNMTAKEIAIKLNKSADSIKHMRIKLNLKKGPAYRWRRKKVIIVFKSFTEKLGRTPSYQECVKKYPGMMVSIHRNWGKYSSFLKSLGLNIKIRRWKKKDCIEEFEGLRRKIGVVPSQKELKRCPGLFRAIIRKWKTYNNFLKELGYTPNFELKWNAEKCLAKFSEIMSDRKNLLTIEELLKINPALCAAIYKYFRNYFSFARMAGYKYNDKWQRWENLVIKISKKLYSNVKIKPKLKNNRQPDIAVVKNNFFDKIIDAKLNSFTNSINKNIEKYGPYCKKLEFWCLLGRKKLETNNVKIINSQEIKRILKQRNEFNLIKEVEAMERLCC